MISPLKFPRGRTRGFVLPLVIIMTVIATILISSVLERQGAQQITLARQAREYRELHFGKGVREVLDMWIRSARSTRDMLAADGKAMDMELGDGTTLSLYLTDVQGSVLTDIAGLADEEFQDAAGAIANLNETVNGSQRSRMVRSIGPAAVSVMSAPVEVLTAVARQAVGSQLADDCVRALLEIREKPHPTQADLGEIETSLNLNDQQRRSLQRMFAVDPTFFRLRLEARAAGASEGSKPVARYEAYAVIPRGGTQRAAAQANAVQRRTLILGWRKLEDR